MQYALDRFRTNIGYARNLESLYRSLSAATTPALDLSDILRAELVMSVSSLDFLIHEIVEIGMREIYSGVRTGTDHFLNYAVPLSGFWGNTAVLANCDWLIQDVRKKHSFKSFQQAEKISEATHIISNKQLWVEVGRLLHQDSGDIKVQLNLIVDRRNKIAHEADMNPTVVGARWPINLLEVSNAVSFIESIGSTIVQVLN
jgi:hypothetical protein